MLVDFFNLPVQCQVTLTAYVHFYLGSWYKRATKLYQYSLQNIIRPRWENWALFSQFPSLLLVNTVLESSITSCLSTDLTVVIGFSQKSWVICLVTCAEAWHDFTDFLGNSYSFKIIVSKRTPLQNSMVSLLLLNALEKTHLWYHWQQKSERLWKLNERKVYVWSFLLELQKRLRCRNPFTVSFLFQIWKKESIQNFLQYTDLLCYKKYATWFSWSLWQERHCELTEKN